MFRKFEFVQTVQPSQNSETIVKFADNIEFTLKRETNFHQIKNIKGEFEITKITESYWCYTRGYCSGRYENTSDIKFDKASNEFSSTCDYSELTFHITASIELKEINEEMCAVKYQLLIPSDCLRRLKLYEYFKKEFVLPGYDVLKFTYYVKKINESEENDIEIHIENPYDVQIQGKKGDFYITKSSESTVDLLLSFYYSLNILDSVKDVDRSYIVDGSELCQTTEHSSIDESRPESVFSSKASKLFKIGTNARYADVYFIASDGEKVPSHRNILVEFSYIFATIFDETSEISVNISAENFTVETIQSALNYLYDKPDAIYGKEMEVFKFAVKFGIQGLIDACISYFEESVDSTNVCEFIQIAYSHNFKELKQKCLKILVEKKEEMDSTKIAELDKNILFDLYFFKL